MDVVLNSQSLLEPGSNGIGNVVRNVSFGPQAFSVSYLFDLDVGVQDVIKPYGSAWSHMALAYSGTSASSTPLSSDLIVAPLPGAHVSDASTNVAAVRRLDTWTANLTYAQPTTDTISLGTFQSWQTLAGGVGDTTYEHYYSAGLSWQQSGPATSVNALAPVSTTELLSMLQANVGNTFANAFYEHALNITRNYSTGDANGILERSEVQYWGDVTIRSVAVVPELDSASMMLCGLAGLMALGCARRRALGNR